MKPKRADIILICALLLIAAASFGAVCFMRDSGDVVVIYVDDDVYGTYPIDENREIEIVTEYGKNVLTISDGCADMTQADCRDLTCVHMRPIKYTGQTIICLPHRVTVRIEGEGSDVDAELR